MTAHGSSRRAGRVPACRRLRQPSRRFRRMGFCLTGEEFTGPGAAATRTGPARGAYAAEAALPASMGMTSSVDSGLRETPGEFLRAGGLVRRIDANLNRAAAELNATGQRSGNLLPCAAERPRRAERPDAAAGEVCERLRQ